MGLDNTPVAMPTIFKLNGKDMGKVIFGKMTRWFDFKDQDSLSIISDPEGICVHNFSENYGSYCQHMSLNLQKKMSLHLSTSKNLYKVKRLHRLEPPLPQKVQVYNPVA